jgi:phosphopantothenoylcysteine decarboxylase/phosphopantothenate--cysteine ligase
MLTNKRILIGVGGGIAAYKVCPVVSTLAQAGAQVQVILTAAAERFVTPLTFATLSRHPAYTDAEFWQPVHGRPLHICLGEWAEVLLIAPLTANTLAKLTYGLADNLLTNAVLASTCPVLLAPAMNTDMWEQPAVQHNWHTMAQQPRYHLAPTGEGMLACDRRGAGRMAEPEQLLTHVQSLLYTQGRRDLAGRRVLVSAGGVREFLDPVRFIGNPSTGKMGLALALAAWHRGATVTLVHGWLTPDLEAGLVGIHCIPALNSEAMQVALQQEFPQADLIVMSAAIADVKPAQTATRKLPKQELPQLLPLVPVPDIVADLARHKQPHQILIGFAAQTDDFVTPAIEKLQRKGLDAIVANPIDQPQRGFGSDTNQAVILDRSGRQVNIPLCSKLEMAHHILDVAQTLAPATSDQATSDQATSDQAMSDQAMSDQAMSDQQVSGSIRLATLD